MTPYAQTNIQLYEQLIKAGYSDSDLETIRGAYELTSQLVVIKFRAHGKTDLAHLVGTTSALVEHDVGLPLILAGLLHNAYITGDFGGFWRRHMTTRKRQTVRRIIGEEAEAIVAQYSLENWDYQRISKLATAVPELSDIDRSVLVLRLANELEEATDLVFDHERRRQRKLGQLHDYAEIARNLDMPRIAEVLQDAQASIQSQKVPDVLTARGTNTYHLTPLSYGRRLLPTTAHVLKQIWGRVPESLRTRYRHWFIGRALKLK